MQPIDAVRNFLPFQVVWGPVLFVLPLTFLLSFLSAWIGAAVALGPFRQAEGQTWVERARLGYPARCVAARTGVLLPLLVFVLVLFQVGPVCPVPPGVLALLSWLAAYAGAALVRYRVERRTGPTLPAVGWLRGEVTTWLVLNPWFVVFLLVTAGAYGRDGRTASAIGCVGIVGMGFFLAGGGVLVARVLGLARPASARLREVVEKMAATVGVRPRSFDEIDLPYANAFALPLAGRLIFTRGLLQILDDEELAAVCAHELGHLGEPRLVSIARVLPVFFTIPIAIGFQVVTAFGITVYVALVVVVLLALVLVRRLAHRLEHGADRVAQAHEGASGTYARALAKLYEANLAPVVHLGKGSHPHLYDRLTAAGVPPEYPRPKPPPRFWLGLGLTVSLTLVMLALGGACFAQFSASQQVASASEKGVLLRFTFWGGNGQELSWLAWIHYLRGEWDRALAIHQAAAQIVPSRSTRRPPRPTGTRLPTLPTWPSLWPHWGVATRPREQFRRRNNGRRRMASAPLR
jgi:Zn-dependent protease with chaperone function